MAGRLPKHPRHSPCNSTMLGVHSQLRDHLRSAVGSSQFVVALNLDIRGFSSFFSDSSQAAAYLSSMYTHILDSYFPEVSFFKPTGDGLLIVREVNRDNLAEVVRDSVENAISLHRDFAALCESDALLNFNLPNLVGIGIARGTATRLSSGDLTLDYSGYPLNLASRLMDLARPSGVVFAESLGVAMLEDGLLSKFTQEQVYIRGLADAEPIHIHRSSEVQIRPDNLTPFGTKVFKEDSIRLTGKVFSSRGRFMENLTYPPASRASIRMIVSWPASTENGSKRRSVWSQVERPDFWTYNPRDPQVLRVEYGRIRDYLLDNGYKDSWQVIVDISYAVALELLPSTPGDTQSGSNPSNAVAATEKEANDPPTVDGEPA